MMDVTVELKNFLDAQGRLVSHQSKRRPRQKLLALHYLAGKFEPGRRYSEKEVNEILQTWHTFGDWAMLRRDLYDRHFLGREAGCSAYWLEERQPTLAEFGHE